ncbi:hypothetical protein [Azohydromonas aeria]|nr:hypothetical protein [Azohydromonas aeria]
MTSFLLLTLFVGIVDVNIRARREFRRWLESQPADVQKRLQAARAWGRV